MAYVMAFSLASLSLSVDRPSKKPFNPLLGETYELIEENKFKFIAEQVSHHPPISAFFAESNDY